MDTANTAQGASISGKTSQAKPQITPNHAAHDCWKPLRPLQRELQESKQAMKKRTDSLQIKSSTTQGPSQLLPRGRMSSIQWMCPHHRELKEMVSTWRSRLGGLLSRGSPFQTPWGRWSPPWGRWSPSSSRRQIRAYRICLRVRQITRQPAAREWISTTPSIKSSNTSYRSESTTKGKKQGDVTGKL